jgi:hypothetical protein
LAVGGTLVSHLTETLSPTQANDVIFGDATSTLEITLNYQAPAVHGPGSVGITTDAIFIQFRNYAFDSALPLDVINGDLVIANSQAIWSPALPEPAEWALVTTGLAGLGARMRMRRKKATLS